MDNVDVYSDVAVTDLQQKVAKLEGEKRYLLTHIEDLQGDVDKLCKELMSMKKTTNNLERNISELYNTAKREIGRKDNMIADLRRELEDLKFRRNESNNKRKHPASTWRNPRRE